MVQNRNYYHTCPACRINIFNADFRIFLYNQAGNKTDEFFFFSFILSFLRLNVPSESCNLFLKAGNIWRVCIYCPFLFILFFQAGKLCMRWCCICPLSFQAGSMLSMACSLSFFFIIILLKSISLCKWAIYKTLHLSFSPLPLSLSL